MSLTIDLHLHTTASDGRCTPRELVDRAKAAGLAVIAVTDHDTVAAVEEVRDLARERGLLAVPGIEITAVERGRDVHVLGYFFDPADRPLADFLTHQRSVRVARVQAIGDRLSALGMPVNLEPLLADGVAGKGRSIGRPQVAQAMVAAGHVADTREAFTRWLGSGCPAFVARAGPSPEEVILVIHRAGGLASLAHPARTGIDDRIDGLHAAGLDALEAFHSDHTALDAARYASAAAERGLLVTGGSDFHGEPAHGVEPGAAGLPLDAWQRLFEARERHAAG